MNFVDCRSSTWKTTARLRSRPRRARCSAREARQPLARIAQRRRRRARPSAIAVAHAALEDRDQQVVLALEIEVDGAGGDAGRAGDVGDLGVEEAALGEDVDGGAEDGVAFRAGRRIGRRGTAAQRPLNECSFSGAALSRTPRTGARPATGDCGNRVRQNRQRAALGRRRRRLAVDREHRESRSRSTPSPRR